MNKIALFGGTGYTGSEVLKQLLQKNYQVSALVRDLSKLEMKQDNLRIVHGDMKDEKLVQEILKGQDAAIQCLGLSGKGDGKPTFFVSEATKTIVDAMEKNKVKRLVCMSNSGAGDSEKFTPWIFKKVILPYFMKWLKVIMDDKNRMEPLVMDSGLDWTLVRPGQILDKPAKGAMIATLDGKGLKTSITKPDLAKFIVDQLEDDQYIRKAPSVSN